MKNIKDAVQTTEAVAEKTGLNIIAFQVAYISEIPKNEAGKVLYSKLDVK